jgi:hypothetical protein
MKICLSTAYTLFNPLGGHLWVFLNWALGLQANGCEVYWLDAVDPATPSAALDMMLGRLKSRIGPYGFADRIALTSLSEQPLPPAFTRLALPLEATVDAALLINIQYKLPAATVARFRRSAFVDIDPGVLQMSIYKGLLQPPPHDIYFTIGETIGTPAYKFPDGGLRWHYTPPCVSLDHWPVYSSSPDAPFTTVSSWTDECWIIDQDGSRHKDDKRAGFQPFLGICKLATGPFELALHLDGDRAEQAALEAAGWRISEAHDVVASPAEFQRYVQLSRGEFSCCKPHCVRLQNTWLSDRTVCYLASGKPAVVQDTGPSRFLPDAAGLFRFRNVEEAVTCLEAVARDYDHHSRLARALAEQYFDARQAMRLVLERALA